MRLLWRPRAKCKKKVNRHDNRTCRELMYSNCQVVCGLIQLLITFVLIMTFLCGKEEMIGDDELRTYTRNKTKRSQSYQLEIYA